MIKMETEGKRGSYPVTQRTRERSGETEKEKKLNARNREAIFYIGLGLKPGAHRRLIFLCGGATASRFTRQICDHKMADSKSNMPEEAEKIQRNVATQNAVAFRSLIRIPSEIFTSYVYVGSQ
ncbi:hypothetical protein KQX54_019107 [Cotesia glomerata]|uniref:Uncharacterized protein n=1 Tax=Cotesia glomerata TaxID=32391 RepID=A0AAV7IGY5_COTGL|nr:hypothetical protein KQX54_019107 [Cotesia glomerata]